MALTTPPSAGLLQDDAIYLSTARGLAEGAGYRHLELPTQPWQTKYPIGYPVLLAPAFWLGDYPANRPWLLLPGVLAGAALVLGSVAYWRGILGASRRLVLGCGLLAACSPALVAFVRYLMSDLVYGALALGSLLCLDRACPPGGADPPQGRWILDRWVPDRWVLGGALLCALALLTRGIGVTLLGAALLLLLLRKRWRQAALFAGVVCLCLAPWWAWRASAVRANAAAAPPALAAPDLDYALWLPDAPGQTLRTVRQNAWQGCFQLAYYQLALPNHPDFVGVAFTRSSWQRLLVHLLVYLSVALCLGGFLVSLRGGWRGLHLYALLYGGLILAWPFDTIRFLVPWSPFVVFFLLSGLEAGLDGLGRRLPVAPARRARWVRATLAAAGALVGLAFLADDLAVARSTPTRYYAREFRLDFAELEQLGEWIARETPPDAVLAAHHNGVLWLRTGRRGYPPWPADDPYALFVGRERAAATFYLRPHPREAEELAAAVRARLPDLYREAGVTHYVEFANGFETAAIAALRAERPEWFRLVHTTPGALFRVYELAWPPQ